MFDTDPNIGLRGIAYDNKAQAEGYAAAYHKWMAYAKNCEARIAEQAEEIARLRRELAIAAADATGRLEQVRAWKGAHPQSPLLAPSGLKFKDGNVKPKDRVLYENAFDAYIRKSGVGITNPADCRID